MAFYSQSAEFDNCIRFTSEVLKHIKAGKPDNILEEAQYMMAHTIHGIKASADQLIKRLVTEYAAQVEIGTQNPEFLKLMKAMPQKIEGMCNASVLQIMQGKDMEHDLLKNLTNVANGLLKRPAEQVTVRGKTYSSHSQEYIEMCVRDACRATDEFNNIVAVRAFKHFIKAMRICQHEMQKYVRSYEPIEKKKITPLLVTSTFSLIFGNDEINVPNELQSIEAKVRPVIRAHLLEMLDEMTRQANLAVSWFSVLVERAKGDKEFKDHGIHQDDVDAVGTFKNLVIAQMRAKIDAEAIVVTNLNVAGMPLPAVRKTVMWHIMAQYDSLANGINALGERIFFEILSENRFLYLDELDDIVMKEDTAKEM